MRCLDAAGESGEAAWAQRVRGGCDLVPIRGSCGDTVGLSAVHNSQHRAGTAILSPPPFEVSTASIFLYVAGMRKAVALAGICALPLTMIASFLIGAVPAQASTCSSKTGGSNDRLVKADNTRTEAKGWNCGYVWTTGNKSIGGWGVQSSISSTANGYRKQYDCTTKSSSVSISKMFVDGGGTVGSAMTYSVGNSSTSTRHWTGAILWMTKTNGDLAANQRNSGCVDYNIYFNAFYEVSVSASPSATTGAVGSTIPVRITVSGPNGPTVNGVQAAIKYQAGSSPNPQTDPNVGGGVVTNGILDTALQVAAPGAGKYYAVFQGSDWAAMVPSASSQGWIPGQSSTFTINGAVTSTEPYVASADRLAAARANMPAGVFAVEKDGKGNLNVSCPAGSSIQTMYVGANNRVYGQGDFALARNKNGIRVNAGDTRTMAQVGCRSTAAKAEVVGKRGFGSVKADIMTVTKRGSLFTGGLGNDVLTAEVNNAHLDGGLGNDTLTLRNGGTAYGSFGRDTLFAEGGGALLVGGPGKDTYRTGSGVVYVNAMDGRGGDVITCGSSKTQIMVDPGDRFFGPCTVKGPGS